MQPKGKRPMNSYSIVSEDQAKIVPYPFVYVNDDGSVRELHSTERAYLETTFQPADGARPYIKDSYARLDGWGSVSGFCHRSLVPPDLKVLDAPIEDPTESIKAAFRETQIRFAREKGLEVSENPDGTLALRKPRSST